MQNKEKILLGWIRKSKHRQTFLLFLYLANRICIQKIKVKINKTIELKKLKRVLRNICANLRLDSISFAFYRKLKQNKSITFLVVSLIHSFQDQVWNLLYGLFAASLHSQKSYTALWISSCWTKTRLEAHFVWLSYAECCLLCDKEPVYLQEACLLLSVEWYSLALSDTGGLFPHSTGPSGNEEEAVMLTDYVSFTALKMCFYNSRCCKRLGQNWF